MSTDYHIVCMTCKQECPDIFASGSIAYGYKVWQMEVSTEQWLGHRDASGKHEGHDLRIMCSDAIEFDSPDETTVRGESK